MTSGTFAYPLCFTAMLVAIGLVVLPRSEAPVSSPEERAAYREIIILNEQKDFTALREKCERFMARYPQSTGYEPVAALAGETMVKTGNWKEVGPYYLELAARFPKSGNMDRFVFFQGLAFFQDANLKDAIPQFERVLKSFPNSSLVENASYYLAMSHFLGNNYRGTLTAAAAYLKKFPEGCFAGDMQYRLAFIDFNDKDVDQTDKIISDLSGFLAAHPDDPVNGSMLCLLADTYKKRNAASDAETKANEDKAIASYTKAVWTESPDDVIQYALESAIHMLRARKDWRAVAGLRAEFLKRKPHSRIAMDWMGEGEVSEAPDGRRRISSDILAAALKPHLADPAEEQVEFLIDLFVKTLVPRKKFSEIHPDELDKQLVELLNKIIAGQENATTTARLAYARDRLAQLLKRKDRSDFHLKAIAIGHSNDPSPLSPALLAGCGEILLKLGDPNGAEMMFKRLKDHFPESRLVDAGPVGLGDVALARKMPDVALGIFEEALKKPDNTRFKEATLGKLRALVDLDQLESAEKLAGEIINVGKEFRGETTAKAYLLLARIYRKQADKAEGEQAVGLLIKAHDIHTRVSIAYKGFPDISAEADKELEDEKLRQ